MHSGGLYFLAVAALIARSAIVLKKLRVVHFFAKTLRARVKVEL